MSEKPLSNPGTASVYVCRHCSLKTDAPKFSDDPCSNGAPHDWRQYHEQPTPSASPHEDLAAYHRLADRLYVLGGDVSSEELYDAIHWLADHLEASRDLLKQERERMGQESPLTDAQYAMKEREAEADDALHLLNATRAILGCTEPMSTLVADAECVRQLAINYRGALSRLVEASDRDLPTRREEARGVLAGQPYDPVEECTEHGSTAVLDGTGLAAVDSIVVGGRKFVPAQPPSDALPEAVRRWLGQNLPDADYMRGTTEREEIVAWRARVLGADVRPSANPSPALMREQEAAWERGRQFERAHLFEIVEVIRRDWARDDARALGVLDYVIRRMRELRPWPKGSSR